MRRRRRRSSSAISSGAWNCEDDVARILIVLGILLIVAGVAMKLGVPLGHLPGDIHVQRGRSTIYFPIVTCIVVSIVLSIVFGLLRR
jgi:Protein of unknown function (DUF2905)